MHQTLELRTRLEDSGPTYLYRFDVDLKENQLKRFFAGKKGKVVKGACHGDDITYVFKSALSRQLNPTSKEFEAIQRMVNLCELNVKVFE